MISGDWIAGFSDGEAWFTIMIAPSKSARTGFNVAPLFRIEINKADINTLYSIQKFLGIGRVWVNKQGRGTYVVSSLPDAQKIKAFFIKYPLQTRKQKTFELWSKALELIEAKKHLTKEGILELARIRDKMNKDTKKESRMNYRDYRYFENRLKHAQYQLQQFND